MLDGGRGRLVQSVVAIGALAEQPIELARVGRQHGARRKERYKLAVARQQVQRVGVEEEGLVYRAQQTPQEGGRTLVRADAGPDGDGVELPQAIRQCGDAIAVRVEVDHGFRNGRLEHHLAPLRQVDGQLTHAAVHASRGG